MRTLSGLGLAAAVLAVPRAAFAQDAVPRTLPIREVTVFKDGHAFVLREGELPVDAAGDVVLDDLPRPVLGTFWPYSAGTDAKLTGVVAGRRRVNVERTALGLADLLRANVGAEAMFNEVGGARWSGKILGFPGRSTTEIDTTSPPGTRAAAPQPGTVMLVETAEGTRAIAVDRIEGVAFKGACRTASATEEQRELLTLRLAWQGPRAETARVGMVYLQKGLRWVPSYRIDIDGKGAAHVRLEATLVNDLADLDHTAVHLVVGVPKFDFKDLADPMALQADFVETASRMRRDSRLGYAGDNALQTQSGSSVDFDPSRSAAGPADRASGVTGAGTNEDLFVFDLADVTLRRGERMTLPVAEFDVRYADVYSVDVAAAPPADVRQSQRNPEEMERLRRSLRPVALHVLRVENTSPFPLTTAPAVILREGRLLGQGQTLYTPAAGRCDVVVTQAVGLRVTKDEAETKRVPDAMKLDGNAYYRIDLAGSIEVANDTDSVREIEVSRRLLGTVDSADHEGAVAMVNVFEDLDTSAWSWWGWYDWPSWWSRLNGVGRVKWKVRVEPRQSVKLAYAWHYFWR